MCVCVSKSVSIFSMCECMCGCVPVSMYVFRLGRSVDESGSIRGSETKEVRLICIPGGRWDLPGSLHCSSWNSVSRRRRRMRRSRGKKKEKWKKEEEKP